jgi:hypothetical protein
LVIVTLGPRLKTLYLAPALLTGVLAALSGCGAARGPLFDWGSSLGGGGGVRGPDAGPDGTVDAPVDASVDVSSVVDAGGPGPGDAGLGLECPAGAACGLQAEYFQMPSYEGRAFNAGSRVLTRLDPQIDFDWSTAPPDAALPGAAFMVRWTGFVRLPLRTPRDDTYHFSVRSDDGVRLWVDEALLIDNWTDHDVTENGGDITLGAGTTVPVKLEYYQHAGLASIALRWSWAGQALSLIPAGVLSPPVESNGLAATYYSGENFDVSAVSRVDLDLGFRWALDSPDPAVPADHFSARWSGTVEPRYAETYTFSLTVAEQNEGVRLSVNNTMIIDALANPSALDSSGSIALQAGQRYPISVEYVETIGAAAIELFWTSPSQPKTRVSWNRLRPTP